MSKKITHEDFILQCKNKFNGKYQYNTKYAGYDKSIMIVCPEHGEFESTPRIHLKNNGGCSLCAGNKKITTEIFIRKSKKIYGNIFDYSKTNYKNINSRLTITCPVHGDFEQFVKAHYNGAGCTKCSRRAKHTTESFISESIKIHGEVYNYDKCIYGKNNKELVTISCKKHGDFQQRPNDHLMGKGCKKCAYESTYSAAVYEIIDFFNLNNIEYELEKTFYGCINKLPLRYDFYLPNENLCIEYDGLQHFKSCGWGGNSKLKLTQTNDEIKNKFCKKTNIKLLRIKYDENHINKLKGYLNIE